MNNIQALRQKRGLTQRDLAERAGVSAGTIACAERPGAMPQLDTAVRLARALGVAVEELLASRVFGVDSKIDAEYAGDVAAALRLLGFEERVERIAGATPREVAQRLAPASRIRRRMAQGVVLGALEHAGCGALVHAHDK